MSGYKGHIAGGIISYVLLMPLILTYHTPSPLINVSWLLAAIAGSLFPDIDIKSKGQKLFYWCIAIIIAFLIAHQEMIAVGWISLASMLPILVRHRGLFHALWFIIACPCAVAWVIACYIPVYTIIVFSHTCFFIAGAVSHLYLDFGLRDIVRWY